jgi:hypothetical protein
MVTDHWVGPKKPRLYQGKGSNQPTNNNTRTDLSVFLFPSSFFARTTSHYVALPFAHTLSQTQTLEHHEHHGPLYLRQSNRIE